MESNWEFQSVSPRPLPLQLALATAASQLLWLLLLVSRWLLEWGWAFPLARPHF